jgi:putative peptide zinc metalloprotease protein
MDSLLGALYRWGGWVFFTWPALLFSLVVSVVGIYLFVLAFGQGTYSLVATASGSYVLGLAILVGLQLLSILIHELAHALTVKHYGREVREAGAMIYLGFPGFFVDTTDIWLEGKRARLAVSWAGPFSGLVLAGMAATTITLWPEFALNSVLFRFAFLSYILVFLNLNPLLKLDGYYLLMDWLEIPMLRSRSLAFLRTGLPSKVRGLAREGAEGARRWRWIQALRGLTREERVFALFGILSAIWTVYAVYFGLSFWRSRLAGAVRTLASGSGSAGGYLLACFVALLSGSFLALMLATPLRLAYGAMRVAWQRGVFAHRWRLAAAMGGLVVALNLVPVIWPRGPAAEVVAVGALLLALVLAGVNMASYSGSRLAAVSLCLGVAALVWLVAAGLQVVAPTLNVPGGQLGQVLDLLALVTLCLAAGILLAEAGLRRSSVVGWAVAAGVLVGGGLLAFHGSAHLGWPMKVQDLLPIALGMLPALGLGLLLPSLPSYWKGASSLAWLSLGLVLLWLVLATVFGLSWSPAYLLLASALALQAVTTAQMRFGLEGRAVRVDLDDGRRLRHSFAWTVQSLHHLAAEIEGEVRAAAMAWAF